MSLVFLSHAVDSLKLLMTKNSQTPKEFFEELRAGHAAVQEEAFVTKLKSIEAEWQLHGVFLTLSREPC